MGINLLFSTIGRNLFKRSFSKTLDAMSKRLISLKMKMICATFHCAVMYPLSKTTLNNWVKYLIPIIGNSLRISPVRRS
jgi:hypothetical protein